ncbi:rhomboid family intramembrane serine protease [Chitinophaga qingshengii]|uniref:Rhomboid family intramembrane serine protease n=1 Tax=Chitinophaga qingshengii TaxID=1569794 RepID=A0ABR7TSZ5_9BACT|nr:rhomboid family intramembrane serine protease [Chitinophaga qingshengii]MBC9933576.1 rhomboid family intramembrane serine protease [Chitinophaga qingshengii]
MNDLFALHYWGSPLFRPHQFITHLFMHSTSSIWHLALNMFTLWMFGTTLENLWGSKRFLIFYIICGIGASLCYMGVLTYENMTLAKYARAFLDDPTFGNFVALDRKFHLDSATESVKGMKDAIAQGNQFAIDMAKIYVKQYVTDYANTTVVGASGAVYGILFAFGYLFPNSIIQLYFFIPVKAKYFVAVIILWEVWAGIQNAPDDNVAHFAHLGGVLFAYLLLRHWSKSNRTDFY